MAIEAGDYICKDILWFITDILSNQEQRYCQFIFPRYIMEMQADNHMVNLSGREVCGPSEFSGCLLAKWYALSLGGVQKR